MEQIKINYLHFCDAATVDAVGKVNILGIFDRFFFPSLPQKYPKFTVVMSLGVKNLAQEKNRIELKFFGPDGKEMDLKPPITVDLTASGNREKQGNLNLILDITNIEFKKDGEHSLVIYFNSKEVAKVSLQVERKSN